MATISSIERTFSGVGGWLTTQTLYTMSGIQKSEKQPTLNFPIAMSSYKSNEPFCYVNRWGLLNVLGA